MNFITGNKFKGLADDFIDQSKPYIDLSTKPKTIFLYTDWLPQFKQTILPNIDYQFKLITHNADMGVYERDIDLLNDPRLVRWFGMNCHVEHDKLTPIPIGIANERWPHGNEDLLRSIADLNLAKQDRIYCNFNPNTTSRRTFVLEAFKGNDSVDIDIGGLSQEHYWRKLASYKYVISPPGNSIDCHRIWESLYLGTTPICLTDIPLKTFNDMSIMFIDSFGDFELKESDGQVEKLSFDYWRDLIE